MDVASEDACHADLTRSPIVFWVLAVLAKVVDLRGHRRRLRVQLPGGPPGQWFWLRRRAQRPLPLTVSLRQAEAVISNMFANHQTSGKAAMGVRSRQVMAIPLR
jgi:hypothetical protein